MKKLLIITLVAVLSSAAFSQVNQGQLMVGGQATFTSSKFGDIDDSKNTYFQLSPNIGYFFINNLAGGLRLNFSSDKDETEDDAYVDFSATPFIRYYFLPAAQKVNIFADGSFGFGSAGQGNKESYNQFGIMAGPAIFLNPHTALEFALAYHSIGGDLYGGNDRYHSFGINVGFQIHLECAKK